MNKLTATLLLYLTILPALASSSHYALSENDYHDTDDLFAAVWQEFHGNAVLADWEDVKNTCSEDPEACMDLADLLTNASPMVYRAGQGRCRVGDYVGHYFITLDASEPPIGFVVYDYIAVASHKISLLCWYGLRPLLVRINDDTNPSGKVTPDLKIYLPSLEYHAPGGLRNIWALLQFYGRGPNGEYLWSLEAYDDRKDSGLGLR